MKALSSICHYDVYENGQEIKMSHMGIILNGAIERISGDEGKERYEDVEYVNVHHTKFKACKDDTVFMHFGEEISHKMIHADTCTNDMVAEAYAEYRKNLANAEASKKMKDFIRQSMEKKDGKTGWFMGMAPKKEEAKGD